MKTPKTNQWNGDNCRSLENSDIAVESGSYYSSSSNETAFISLITGIEHQHKLMVLTGENGVGKTLLLHKIMQQAAAPFRYVFCASGRISFEALLQLICDPKQTPVSGLHRSGKMNALEQYLSVCAQQGIRIVLVIDEAHQLTENVLSYVLALTQSVQQNQLPLQIILSGQPILEQQLLRQRLLFPIVNHAVYTHLQPLSASEIPVFIKCQLQMANNPYDVVFPPQVIESIIRHSQGIPGFINTLCNSALAIHQQQGESRVAAETIEHLATDLLKQESLTILHSDESTANVQLEEEIEQDTTKSADLLANLPVQSSRSSRRFSARWLLLAAIVGGIGGYGILFAKNNYDSIFNILNRVSAVIKPKPDRILAASTVVIDELAIATKTDSAPNQSLSLQQPVVSLVSSTAISEPMKKSKSTAQHADSTLID